MSEESPVAANPVHQDFVSIACNRSKVGLVTLRDLEALANDYVDLGYAPNGNDPITTVDTLGTANDKVNPMDIATAIQGIAAIGEVLNANDGALRKAFKRLAANSH